MIKKLLAAASLAACVSTACSSSDDDASASSITFTVSGETTAVTGFAFPPTSRDDIAFVDGWEVRFDRVLVTVDDIVLTENPDVSPTDQSQTGPAVAQAKGPWAVNLSREGAPGATTPGATTGRGSVEDKSIRLVRLTGQNLRGNAGFDGSVRYGFGYKVVTASAGAIRVDLDPDASKDYDEMVAKGWSTLYVGTATFRGGTSCKSSVDGYDFSKLPTIVKFRLGFATPVSYANCQNSDLTGKAFEGEEAQRGVQIEGPTFAQLTFHLEHVFWDTVDHDQARPFFDTFALAAKNGVVTSDDLAALDPSGFADPAGTALPWRSCLADVAPPPGTRKADTGSVPVVGRAGDPGAGLRHLADFAAYQQSTMGHLNADGLCAVARAYPSPR